MKIKNTFFSVDIEKRSESRGQDNVQPDYALKGFFVGLLISIFPVAFFLYTNFELCRDNRGSGSLCGLGLGLAAWTAIIVSLGSSLIYWIYGKIKNKK